MRISEDLARAIMVFVCVTIVFSALTYMALTPRPREQFFQIYVLGENRMAERYYPDNNPNISVWREVKWYGGVTNFMGAVQYVVVKAKLGNSTIMPPSERGSTPSPAPVLLESRRVLTHNETWEFPFFWTIREVRSVGGTTELVLLEVNGALIGDRRVSAVGGRNFRIIFELWTLDEESGNEVFGWRAGAERRVAWLQVWFNTTSVRPS